MEPAIQYQVINEAYYYSFYLGHRGGTVHFPEMGHMRVTYMYINTCIGNSTESGTVQ